MDTVGIPIEVLLAHSSTEPCTPLHIKNHLILYIDSYPDLPETYMRPGAPIVMTKVPEVESLTIIPKEGGKIPGIAVEGDNKKFRMTTADPMRPQGDFYALFRDMHVEKLGICTLASWDSFAQVIMMSLDMLVLFKTNVADSKCTSAEDGGYLHKGLMSIIKFMADETFSFIGPRVDFQVAKDLLLMNSYPTDKEALSKKVVNPKAEPSKLAKEVASGDAHDVKCICLNEFKGDVDIFNGSDSIKWRFYLVPSRAVTAVDPSDVKGSLMNQQANFIEMNNGNAGSTFVRDNWLNNAMVRLNLGVFAVRD
jgi:hypothetical protein